MTLKTTDWARSSYCNAANDCVEMALFGARVGVRDSKDPTRGHLSLSSASLTAFVEFASRLDLSDKSSLRG